MVLKGTSGHFQGYLMQMALDFILSNCPLSLSVFFLLFYLLQKPPSEKGLQGPVPLGGKRTLYSPLRNTLVCGWLFLYQSFSPLEFFYFGFLLFEI